MKNPPDEHTHTWSDYDENGIAECLLCPKYRMKVEKPISVMEALRRQGEKEGER